MRLEITARDVIGLLGVVTAAALAVSLGLDPVRAAEIAVVIALLLLVAVLLRATPEARPQGTRSSDVDALTTARRAVEGALSGPWGVRGRFRRVVRASFEARLDHRGPDVDEVLETLPPLVALVLRGEWDHDRGLTETELDQVLTAIEELDP